MLHRLRRSGAKNNLATLRDTSGPEAAMAAMGYQCHEANSLADVLALLIPKPITTDKPRKDSARTRKVHEI